MEQPVVLVSHTANRGDTDVIFEIKTVPQEPALFILTVTDPFYQHINPLIELVFLNAANEEIPMAIEVEGQLTEFVWSCAPLSTEAAAQYAGHAGMVTLKAASALPTVFAYINKCAHGLIILTRVIPKCFMCAAVTELAPLANVTRKICVHCYHSELDKTKQAISQFRKLVPTTLPEGWGSL